MKMANTTDDPPHPLGVPTACFVHLDDGRNPTATSAMDVGGGKVAIDGRPQEVDGVFDARLDKEVDMFEQVLNFVEEDANRPVPLQAFVEDAVSICTILLGTCVGTKRDLFHGPDDDEDSLGMSGWIFDPVFQLLRDKAFGIQEGYYEFDVDVSFYEIFDEIITDLLKPDNVDLQVKLHPTRGIEVEGLSKTRIDTPQEGRRVIKAGKRSRRTQMLPNGPAKDSASAVLQIHLHQREGESQEEYRHLQSVALIVEVPSTHKLISTPDDLRLTQGPTLNRSLLAFKEVAKALSSEKEVRFAPFGDGKLTEALQTYLGGNALVLAVVGLSRSDSIKVNTATMAVIQHLQEAMHYPVANTELIQGLVLKYQFMLASFSGAKGFGRGAGVDGAVNAQRMRALEAQVLQARMESNESKEDAAKVYKMLELFKAKYVKLVETKSSQSMELITAEEGKLAVSRSLLDLKLEHSSVLEKFESERYALTTDLLTAKNEVVELEMGLQESEAARASREREAATAVAEREAMQEKLSEAEKAVKELQQKFEAEEAKSVEMAAELLTLVNQKTHLEAVRKDLERQLEDFSARIRMLELELRTTRDEIRVLKEDTEEAEQKVKVLEIAKAKAELDLQRAQVEWESQVLDNHRSTVARDHNRESELLENHMKDLDQLAAMKQENEDLVKGQERLRSEIRQGKRRLDQAQQEITHKMADLADSQHELAATNEELENLRQKFRHQMESFIGGKSVRKGSRKGQDQSVAGEATKRVALQEMVAAFKDREDKATSDAKHFRDEAKDAKLKNRVLFDKYKELQGLVEDSLGKEHVPPDLPPDNELIVAGAESGATDREGVDIEGLAAMKARLKVAESELCAQQEKNVLVATEYSELVQKLEQRQREDSLQIGRLENENTLLKAGLDNTSQSQQKQMEDMKAMVIKMTSGAQNTRSESREQTPRSSEGLRDMKFRLRQAEKERDAALVEVSTMRNQQHLLGEEMSTNEMKVLAAEVERVGRENAKLKSQKATCEGELERFKNYMRETVGQYQERIQQLQKELKQAKGHHT